MINTQVRSEFKKGLDSLPNIYLRLFSSKIVLLSVVKNRDWTKTLSAIFFEELKQDDRI